jgi:NAD(P)H-nitrite reductase large subunit
MKEFKYLIVGGGIAGTTAAETIRAKDSDGSIAIITDEPYPLYSRVMLSKPSFLLEKTPKANIWLKTDDWYKKNRIELVSGKSVVALDVVAKTVTVGGGEIFGYEKLLLAVGARARRWDIPGADKKGIYYLRTLDEAKEIAAAMKTAKRAVVIGSSCVAFEAIENLRSAGIEVAEVMLEKYFWEPMLDEEGGRIVEKVLTEAGVKIFRQSEVKEVLGGENVDGVITKNGEKIGCDMILCGIGVIYPVEWAKAAGVKVNRGVVVNEYLETNTPDVWAAGDVAEYSDVVLEEQCMAGNWMNAREQGRIAALNMMASFDPFDLVQGRPESGRTGDKLRIKKEKFRLVSFYTSHGFGLNVAFGGDIRLLPERTAISRGSAESARHTRLILHGGRIVGVAMVDRIFELGTIVKLIENRTDVSAKHKELSDPNFDLKAFL